MSYIVLPDGTVEFNQEINDEGKRENLTFLEWLQKCHKALMGYETKR